MEIPTDITLLCSGYGLLDKDGFGFNKLDSGLSDPYYTVWHGEDLLFTSEVIYDNLYPQWAAAKLELTGLNEDSVLFFQVTDKDKWSKDDFLGSVDIILGDLLAQGHIKADLEKPGSSKTGGRGEFQVLITTEQSTEDAYFRDIHNVLHRSFPTTSKENPDEISAYIDRMKEESDGSDNPFTLKTIGEFVGGFFEGVAEAVINPNTIGYPVYKMDSHHDRHIPFPSSFHGEVISIKIPLGKDFTHEVSTSVGDISKDDHFLFSVDDVNEKYASEAGFEAERVDLITPLRFRGFRFAPVCIYMVYKNTEDTIPAYYILESGTGLGIKAVLYYCPGGEGTSYSEHKGGYKPTPFSSEDNIYKATVTSTGEDPTSVVLDIYQPDTEHPYITVTLNYIKLQDLEESHNHDVPQEENIHPSKLTLHAFERIQVLEDGFGMLHKAQFVMRDFAVEGRKLPWDPQPPVNVAPPKEE